MSANRTTRMTVLGCLMAAACAAGLWAGLLTSTAGAKRRAHATASVHAADCQPFSSTPCLLPFPNNLFTRPDHSSATGLRVQLPPAAMPVNTRGQRISVAQYDRNDGFSPGSVLILHVAGLDNSTAFARTGAAGLLNMSQAFAKHQPIVVIDEQTGQRQLIWSELDANASSPQDTDLMIHPGKNFTEGHTYVVALRDLRTASGAEIAAPSWFAKLRDNSHLPANEQAQKARYAKIFAALRRVGVSRNSHLYEAWDFTIASERSLSSRLLAIRNNAFAQLGDTNLADGQVAGHAPAYQVASVDTSIAGFTRVQGTFTVPCYLITCGASATTGFHYGSSSVDATPTQIPGNTATAPFECMIPNTASPSSPARLSLYGHGLLGSHTEVEAGNVEAMATEHNMTFCATDWWGLAEGDIPGDIAALGNLNLFPNVIDRLQQGVLNTLYLGRLMLNPEGFASNAAFQSSGQPVIDTSNLYYDGNSQGGIEGGLTTAVAPDFRHAVLGVTGMNYGGMLLLRSSDFTAYASVLYPSYPDQSMHPVILDLMQQLWDRGDPDGYAQHMTSNPLPDTPSHVVLMQIAYGDHQVSMYAGAAEARTIGASVYEPALDPARSRDRNLFYGIPPIRSFPYSGSAVEIWDDGPGLVPPPPVTDMPPPTSAHDPHEDVRSSPAARTQKSAFLEPSGTVIDVCGGTPCHTYLFTP